MTPPIEKESKLQWNDKAQEWQSWPPGATTVMPLPQSAGKVTIVKEKFYPADKELIDKLQADNARLRDFVLLVMRGCENGSVKAQPVMDLSDENAETLELESLYSLAKKRIASTDSSSWLQEQKAQWRREVLLDVETEIANKLLTDGYKAVQVIRRLAESTKAETDSLQNPAGKY